MITIRQILYTAIFILAADWAQSQDAYTVEVADNVYSYGNPAMGYFSMFVVTDDGVIAIEPVNTQHSQGLLSAIQSVTDQPNRYLLHSHNNNSTALQGGIRQDVTDTLRFMSDLRGAIHAEIEKGTNPFMIPNIVRLPEYNGWAMYDQWLVMNAWRVLLDEHMGPYPWRPE